MMERKHTNNELFAMVQDKNRIIAKEDIAEILDTCWPVEYKDTFIVPDGEALCFRGGGILVNGKNDVPKLKALGEKEKAGELLLRRSVINRVLAGETDCLNEPLTPEAIERFETERDTIQAGILRAVEAVLVPDSITMPPGQETPVNGTFWGNNGEISLPPEIDTPKARKAFEKAIKAGYLGKTSTGNYQWKVSKTLPKAAAAYLCKQIYDKPKWRLLGQFLNLSRLSQTAYQNEWTTKYKKKRPWKSKIDALFED